ncbi:hypothetical protein JYT87_03750 [Nitrospira defluvii]|nr:hypothetical protein [Nitrospira defluvii]
MAIFDPYFTFRLALALLFTAYILYDLIAMLVWYRSLPEILKKLIFLKLLQVKSRTLKLEMGLIITLLSVDGGLMFHLLKGV